MSARREGNWETLNDGLGQLLDMGSWDQNADAVGVQSLFRRPNPCARLCARDRWQVKSRRASSILENEVQYSWRRLNPA